MMLLLGFDHEEGGLHIILPADHSFTNMYRLLEDSTDCLLIHITNLYVTHRQLHQFEEYTDAFCVPIPASRIF